MAGNQAVAINSADVGIALTEHGSDWLWTVFSIFGLTTLVHAFLVFNNHRKQNKFKVALHAAPLFLSAILTYTYFTTASNLGWAGVQSEFNHIETGDDYRQVFYARYIGWFLSYPALLFLFEYNAQAQNVLANLELIPFFTNLVLQIASWEVFVLGLLIGSLITSTYKWGYWTFAASALLFGLGLFIYRQLFGSNAARSVLNILSVSFFALVSILYTVSWGLSEGGNVIQPDSEAVFYGVLDLINFWIIPIVLIVDSFKNGTFVESSTIPATQKDLEKVIDNDTPELRASGETEVNATNQDVDQLETQHA